MNIKGTTKLLGIIGDPIEHSKSPLMQNAAIAALNLDYVYVPFEVKKEDLQTVFKGFQAINLRGFNVTIPHKENVIPLLTNITECANKIGAVNTVWLTDEGWHGTNTDIDGFIAPLKKLNKNWSKIVPLIIGAGGASRAVIVGCEQLGCKEIRVIGRNLEKLEVFKNSFAKSNLNCQISIYSWDKLTNLIPDSELIVNTTPLGMYPNIDNSPLTKEQNDLIKKDTITYDLIYTPRPTLFLQQALKREAIIIDGSEMLIQQGAMAFEIWTGKKPPVDVMRQALLG
ncbi:MAG: shikimate dehydrogenase [Cyanobacteria bacterium]|nr:shikimate dehydrogenase [Cyanobacteria bacterium CG_2015-16_32_12]NCO76791.1 shikimate dehydrogenase [Cyanobacteria bacterium CG_2015-22_32_23]NCQ05794.1 shikimate dehydrogenase [Cyanobacteria bacterium CG_2015-09_32_10]NCQ43210.1 shikimate dehydrogenase [Cyanobacteria bacterium CG_2015-04_32_10]